MGTTINNGVFTDVAGNVTNYYSSTSGGDPLVAALKPVQIPSYKDICMPDTRKAILHSVRDWLGRTDVPNIFVLSGSPGSGKSTIAATVVRELTNSQRLAAGFRFKRSEVDDASRVWPTVAYRLACFSGEVRNTLLDIFKHDPNIDTIAWQFEELIKKPLSSCYAVPHETTLLPVVVIDALDECDRTVKSYRQLYETLEMWSHLPSSCKLFITARGESVDSSLLLVATHVVLLTGSQTLKETHVDIRSYMLKELSDYGQHLCGIKRNWPDSHTLDVLTEKAAGLFISAATMVRFITDNAEENPKGRLQKVLSGNMKNGDVQSLYMAIFKNAFSNTSAERMTALKTILAVILTAKRPLQSSTLKDFLAPYVSEDDVLMMLRKLKSILLDINGCIQVCHLSVIEFLCNNEESSHFYIDLDQHKLQVAELCFITMNRELKFNICEIESSYLPNSAIEDLQSRITSCIPDYLSYASCYWGQHIENLVVDKSDGIYTEIKLFLHKHFLHWLEVLSLLCDMQPLRVIRALTYLGKSIHAVNIDLHNLCNDAIQFINTFHVPISTSVPHIYLSALQWCPQESLISKQYQNIKSGLITYGQVNNLWSAELNILKGHTDIVFSVAFSADGTKVASGSRDNTIRIWDTQTGQTVAGPFQGHTDHISSVAFSPDGTRVASGSYDRTIRIWDTQTGKNVADPFEGHTAYVFFVDFSPDGTKVASGSYDNTIRIWDIETGHTVAGPFQGHTGAVNSVVFSPDGATVASGSDDGTIRIWDTQTGTTTKGLFQGHTNYVHSVAFSPDGTKIASGSDDETIRIWDTKTGKTVASPLQGHSGCVRSVALSPDGARVASGAYDRTIRIWDIETGQTVAGPFQGHIDYVRSVAFSPDGTKVASGSDDKTVRIWNIQTGQTVAGLFQGHNDAVFSVAFSPDGTTIASGSNDATIRIWNTQTGQSLKGSFQGHTGYVRSVAFSPDGTKIASGSYDTTIRIWDIQTGITVNSAFQGHTGYVYSVAFSPDGTQVASGSYDKTIRIWNVQTGQTVASPFECHIGAINSVAFSPDGTKVASGSNDRTIRIWDTKTGKTLASPFKGHSKDVNSVAFSPDGTKVVSGSDDRTIRIWDVQTGQTVAGPFLGHTGDVHSVAFSPDSTKVASGSDDSTVRIWDIQIGQTVAGPFHGHNDWVFSVAFSLDGTKVASGSYDRTLRIWCIDRAIAAPSVSNAQEYSTYDEQSGWITFVQGQELLLWIPYSERRSLCGWRMLAICGAHMVTLDFTKFLCGKLWTECYTKGPNENIYTSVHSLSSPSSVIKPKQNEMDDASKATPSKERMAKHSQAVKGLKRLSEWLQRKKNASDVS